jgi:glycosyltransferase involved in cell wall biosynthesis
VLFVSASSQMIAYVETDIPIIYMTDASFQQLQGYYPSFSNLANYNIRQGIELDKKAFQKAAHCMLASEWTKNSAVNDYGIEPGKISVVPCGANLDKIPATSDLYNPATDQYRLLFLGVEWGRKGGDIALETFQLLKKQGIPAHLHIIGCVPPVDISGEKDITVIPFLDKSKEEDVKKLESIFLQTHFLLLPTRAECAGIVFSEASAFGIPSITTDTGGVTTYIRNGMNGYALPYGAKGQEYAQQIKKILGSPINFEVLKKRSRAYYEMNLSWDLWGQQFHKIAENCLQQKEEKK